MASSSAGDLPELNTQQGKHGFMSGSYVMTC